MRLCKGAYAEPESVAFNNRLDVDKSYARCMSLEWRCRMGYLVEVAGGAEPMPPDASQRLARGIDRRGYPGLWEAMARREIQLDPRVLREG